MQTLGRVLPHPSFISGQLRGCRANEEITVLWLLLVPCSWLSAIQGPVRGLAVSSPRLPSLGGASGRGPLESIIYRSDRLPTLILRMGIWDTRSHVGLFLCQQSIQHGTSHSHRTRHGQHKEIACLQKTQLVPNWGCISFLQPRVEGARTDQIISNVLCDNMVPTC